MKEAKTTCEVAEGREQWHKIKNYQDVRKHKPLYPSCNCWKVKSKLVPHIYLEPTGPKTYIRRNFHIFMNVLGATIFVGKIEATPYEVTDISLTRKLSRQELGGIRTLAMGASKRLYLEEYSS